MWIRSQDKESLVKVDTLRMYYLTNQGWGIFTNNHVSPNDRMALGYYSTKEKALKVLDMIEECLNTKIIDIDIEGNISRQIYKADGVFQIPQDDEV